MHGAHRVRAGSLAGSLTVRGCRVAPDVHTNEGMTMEKERGSAGPTRDRLPGLEGAAQQGWVIDTERSKLTFALRHIIVQRIEGRFERWGGTLFVDREQPSLSSVEIWIDLASITTGDAERDAHVRSSEFLDVEHFPRAKFTSDLVQPRDEEVVVNGRLELHGVDHDVQVTVTVGDTSIDPDGRARARYTARAVIDRQSFGLHWNQDLDVGGVVLGDEVEIRGNVELVRVEEPGAAPAPRG
jgi:polyisoprenoid-binding protein YceI